MKQPHQQAIFVFFVTAAIILFLPYLTFSFSFFLNEINQS
jgi:hypothetical protein